MAKSKGVKVFLREKKLKGNKKSLYLDFYPPIKSPKTGKLSRREFLGLYIYAKPRNPNETQHNKETKAVAEKIKVERYTQILEGTYGSGTESMRDESFLKFFYELVKKRYTSKGNYDNWLNAYRYFKDFFEDDLTMGELSMEVLEDYKEYLLDLELAQNTKHAYYNKLKAAVKEAFRKGYIKENYAARIPGIKSEETKREFLTLEELQTLAKTPCDNELIKQAFIFSALTGLRFSDVRNLKWGDLQHDEEIGHFIRFRQEKTNGEETLPIPKPAVELLGEKQPGNTSLFKGLHYSAWNNLRIREWVMRAGIDKKITFHCARHSFATIQLTLGTDIYTVSKLLGHKELKTTQIYAKIIDQKKTDAMNKLNDFEL